MRTSGLAALSLTIHFLACISYFWPGLVSPETILSIADCAFVNTVTRSGVVRYAEVSDAVCCAVVAQPPVAKCGSAVQPNIVVVSNFARD